MLPLVKFTDKSVTKNKSDDQLDFEIVGFSVRFFDTKDRDNSYTMWGFEIRTSVVQLWQFLLDYNAYSIIR